MSKILSVVGVILSLLFFIPFLSIVGFVIALVSLVHSFKEMSDSKKFEVICLIITIIFSAVNIYFSKMFLNVFVDIFTKAFI